MTATTTHPYRQRSALRAVELQLPTRTTTVPDRRAPTFDDLQRLVEEVAADIAVRDEADAETERRAQLLIDALAPIVRLPPPGGATVQDRRVVSLRELAIVQRWLARAADVPGHEVVRAIARIQQGLTT